MKYFIFTFVLFMASCNGCQKIPSNQIVLNSDNYGKDWRQLGSTETVPRCGMPGCYNVYLPATTMGGELSSVQRVGKTGESAKVKMLYTYMWEIRDPLAFIKEAKEIRNGDYTSDGSLEIIEARLIDRHFHEISARLLVDEDVKRFDQALFEGRLTPELNKDMEKYGILITGVSVVPQFGEQLETALDAAQALEVYKSIGEEQLGKEIIKEKAGATIINVKVDATPTQNSAD